MEAYSLFNVFKLYEKYKDVDKVVADIDGNEETIRRNIRFFNAVNKYYSQKHNNPIKQANRFDYLENNYWKKKYNELLNLQAFEDRIVNLLDNSLQKYPSINVTSKKINKPYHEVVLLLSDFHAGEEIIPTEILNLNEFNMDILKDRLDKLFNNIVCLFETYNLFDVNKINIWLLGDMVSGIIHEELLQGTSVVDEVVFTGEYVSSMLYNFAKEFKNVSVCCVIGNHGRFDKKPHNKKKYSNLDYLLYKYMEAKCSNLTNISFNIPKSPFIIESIFDYNFFISHGDTYTKSAMYPQSGVRRTSDNITNTLSYKQNKYIHYYCLGHYHNVNQFDRPGGKIIMNGSLVGYNEYAFNKNLGFSEPKQISFVVDDRFGVNTVMEVPVE